jgi:hypothetical protein
MLRLAGNKFQLKKEIYQLLGRKNRPASAALFAGSEDGVLAVKKHYICTLKYNKVMKH